MRYCAAYGCPWRNAEWKWAEQQAIFGTGWARADDIVAHELIHGLLDHEVPLFYQYQSGAINESLADIFGELVDLCMTPAARTRRRPRWLIGEDTPMGAFRDMQDPPRFRHPDRVRSPLWHAERLPTTVACTATAAWATRRPRLIADGGTFHGYRVGRHRTRRARRASSTRR